MWLQLNEVLELRNEVEIALSGNLRISQCDLSCFSFIRHCLSRWFLSQNVCLYFHEVTTLDWDLFSWKKELFKLNEDSV